MITSAVKHARQNVVAYLALFVALGGTSYAAINLPAGSVGARQLRNHSISPVKFDRQFINGSIRAWVVAAPNGTIQASAGRPTVHLVKGVPGDYVLHWQVPTPSQRGCFALGGLTGENGQVGSAEVSLGVPDRAKQLWVVDVGTYGAQGQPLPEYFYAALIC